MFNGERERTINCALRHAAHFVVNGNLCDAKAAIDVAEIGYAQIRREKNVWVKLLERYSDFKNEEEE